jgi:hypothetical protein
LGDEKDGYYDPADGFYTEIKCIPFLLRDYKYIGIANTLNEQSRFLYETKVRDSIDLELLKLLFADFYIRVLGQIGDELTCRLMLGSVSNPERSMITSLKPITFRELAYELDNRKMALKSAMTFDPDYLRAKNFIDLAWYFVFRRADYSMDQSRDKMYALGELRRVFTDVFRDIVINRRRAGDTAFSIRSLDLSGYRNTELMVTIYSLTFPNNTKMRAELTEKFNQPIQMCLCMLKH